MTGLTTTVGRDGAVTLAWTNPPDAARDLVVRGPGSACPHFPSDGTAIGNRRLRTTQVDSAPPSTATTCYAVYAIDSAGNKSDIVDRFRGPGVHADIDPGHEPRVAS